MNTNRGDQLGPWDDRMLVAMLFLIPVFSLMPPGFVWWEYQELIDGTATGGWRFRLQWITIYAIAAVVLLRHYKRASQIASQANPFLLLMLVYVALNIAWSDDAEVTIRRVIQFTGFIAAAIALQLSERTRDDMDGLILLPITAMLSASVVVALLIPSWGHDSVFGTAWKGIFSTKNTLGSVAALGSILWVLRMDRPSPNWWLIFFGMTISVLCMIKSTSSTGISSSILGVTAVLMLRRPYIKSPLWLVRIFIAVGMIFLIGFQVFFIYESRLPSWDEIVSPVALFFGKGTDLTGRTELWALLKIEIEKHPFFGIGWGAYWLGPGSASQSTIDNLPWVPFQGHNGYLDIINELGFIGFFIFLCMLCWHVVQLFRLGQVRRPEAVFHTAILAVILFTNITESTLYKAVSFEHILLILSSVSVSSALARSHSRGIN